MLTDLDADKRSIFFNCIESCLEPIMITNLDGLLIYVNPAWESLYGFTAAEAIGNSLSLISCEAAEHPKHSLGPDLVSGEVGHWRGEVLHKAKGGRPVWVHLTISTYYQDKGPAGHMATAMDISEQKLLEARIAKQDRLATIGELTSGLAHEIGTPIGVIRGRAEMLSMFLDPKDQRQQELDVIIRQTDRITTLINTLLRLSRSPDEIEMGPLALLPILQETALLLEQKLRRYNVTLTLNVAPDQKACAEANRLEQIFINLIMNSISAIAKRADPSPPGRIDVSVREHEQELLIQVDDNGCGIEPKHLDKIFDPFFTTKAAGEGTGLGLSIVARVVSELGGRIAVASTPQQGSIFSIGLRKAQPNEPHKDSLSQHFVRSS